MHGGSGVTLRVVGFLDRMDFSRSRLFRPQTIQIGTDSRLLHRGFLPHPAAFQRHDHRIPDDIDYWHTLFTPSYLAGFQSKPISKIRLIFIWAHPRKTRTELISLQYNSYFYNLTHNTSV